MEPHKCTEFAYLSKELFNPVEDNNSLANNFFFSSFCSLWNPSTFKQLQLFFL